MPSSCFNCKWLYRWAEHNYSSIFICGEIYSEKWSEKLFFPPRIMCQHPSCFKKPEDSYKYRVKGQYQLNKDGNCQFYKKKWYLFWKK